MNGSRLGNRVVSGNGKGASRRRSDGEINCLWASRIGERVVGLVHLVGVGRQTASITLFRVDPEYRHTVVLTNLIDRVRDFCGGRGCLTVQLESHVAPRWVLRQFDARGLRLVHRALACGRDVLTFHLDPCWKPMNLPQLPPHLQEADNARPAVQEAAGELVAGAS